MVTSDFRPEVKIRPFRACAIKTTQYNAHLWPNRRNSRVLKEIGVEEHDGEVRFQTGSGNIALSFMREACGHNYRNSLFIVDVVMGQIPRSTERISSFKCCHTYYTVHIICDITLCWHFVCLYFRHFLAKSGRQELGDNILRTVSSTTVI